MGGEDCLKGEMAVIEKWQMICVKGFVWSPEQEIASLGTRSSSSGWIVTRGLSAGSGVSSPNVKALARVSIYSVLSRRNAVAEHFLHSV